MSSLELPERYVLDPDPILGEGGMGRVLRARDVALGVQVALKIVRPDYAADVRFRKLFDLEVRMSARFAHPNIVPLHDLGTLADGTPYLGLAYADAGSFARLREEGVSWEELLRLMLELVDALSHLHARRVLHRDLKPENVLLHHGDDGKVHVWLADLGLANAQGSLARGKGRVEGTPGFMAPEQRLGLVREVGPWTDLYSVGVMLWQIVTDTLPFPEGLSALDAPLPPLTPRAGLAVPERLETILKNLLHPEPLSRYDLALDLRTELLALGPAKVGGESVRIRVEDRVPGTVAAAVPLPSETSPSRAALELSEPEEDENRTLHEMAVPNPKSLAKNVEAPRWNRPKPAPIPLRIPRESGTGATARGSLALFALREIPMVARDEYRQMLWNEARTVIREGSTRVVLVVGEAGAGKTRLVESVVRALEEGGWGEAVEATHQNPPGKDDGYVGAARALLRPWNETRPSLTGRLQRVLGRARGIIDESVREEAQVLARWCGLLDGDEQPVPVGYGLREVYRHLEAISWRGLGVLSLDDAQWSTEEGGGLSIAESALRAGSEGLQRKLLVVLSIRAEDLAKDGSLAERVDGLVAAGAKRIDLPRLDQGGIDLLLRECLTLAPDLASAVAERCEGNPLFARQLLIEWTERNWLVDTGGLVYGLAEGVDVDAVLPADAEALFRARVVALAETSAVPRRFVDALHTLALAGAAFPRELVAHVGGADLAPFLTSCGLWVERGTLLRFDHGLLHQSMRHEAERRRDFAYLERRLAKAWMRYGEQQGVDVATEVARHAHAGEDWALAVDQGLVAAEKAWHIGDTKELWDASSLAEDAANRDPAMADRLPRTTYWMARAAQAVGEVQLASERYLHARALAVEHGDVNAALKAQLGLAWAALQLGDLGAAESLYQEVYQRARKEKSGTLESEAIAGLAWIEQQKRNFEGASILFTRLGNRCAQLDDTRGAGEALLGQGYVSRRIGEWDEANEFYKEALEHWESHDEFVGMARAHLGLGEVARQLRRNDAAEQHFRDAMRIADELGATTLGMEARFGLADLYRHQGAVDRAAAIYEQHVRWAQRQKLFEAEVLGHHGLALAALELGDTRRCYEATTDAARCLAGAPAHWLWASYRLIVATLLTMRGEGEEAYRWLWAASDLGLADTVDRDVATCLSRIADESERSGWINPLRVAGKLGIDQWQRLRSGEPARRLQEQVARAG